MTLQSLQKRGLHSSSRAESGSPLLAKSSSPARGKDASCPKAFCGGSCKVPVDLAANDIGGEVEGRLGKGSQTCCKRIIRQESHEHNPVGDRGWMESSNLKQPGKKIKMRAQQYDTGMTPNILLSKPPLGHPSSILA